MKRFTNHKEPWGKFIDIKVNAPPLLDKEMARAKKGTIFLSSVTDPYNPIETKYKLTRQILKILLKYQFPLSILTKSDLIIRDIDLLKQFKDLEVGFSFLSLNKKDAVNFEMLTVPPLRRLDAIKQLKNNNITTYAFIAPIMPGITDLKAFFAKHRFYFL